MNVNGKLDSSIDSETEVKSVGESADVPDSMVRTPNDDILVSFKSKLVEHYKDEYCTVATLPNCQKKLKDVWVPLSIQETTHSHRSDETFDHQELLKRLTKKGSSNIAIVSGDPGTGKTTLVKKIVLDWATNEAHQFSVVLAVPLKYMKSTDDWLQMAVDYYANILKFPWGRLFKALAQLDNDKLLICLDGLDECSCLGQRPFKGLFKNRDSMEEEIPDPVPALRYKLLLTSRPYACDVINPDFCPLKFKIVSLDEAGLKNFIRYYCETSDAVEKVTRYLEQNAEWVSKVPLILTFVCSLAGLSSQIPRELTLLYEKILGNMIEREAKKNTIELSEGESSQNWKDMEVVKLTSRLAFDGCKNKTYVFLLNDLKMIKNSFTCGFLLPKFDFSSLRKIADFPHRSIQEFFAALHCHQMISGEMSTIGKTERNAIMKEIFNHDSQFRRFFFGLCSHNGHFEKVVDWLRPTFEDTKLDLFGINSFIEILSNSLSDCEDVDAAVLGARLAASVDQLEDQIKTGGNQKILTSWPGDFTSMNNSFQRGLNLNFFDKNKRNWYLTLNNNSKWARLAYVYVDPPDTMRDKLDRIDIFKWEWNINRLDVASLDQLPPIFVLNVTVDHSVGLEINFDLKYNITNPRLLAAASLQKFTFGFPNNPSDIDQLKEKFSDEFDSLVVAGETQITGERGKIFSLSVTIIGEIGQTQLLGALVRLALRIRDENYKKEITPTTVETRSVKIFVPLALETLSFRENLKVDHELGTSFLMSEDGIEFNEILVLLSRELASCENEDIKKRIKTSLKMLLTLNSRLEQGRDLQSIRHYSEILDDDDEQRSNWCSKWCSMQPSKQRLKIFIWKHSQETQLALEIVFFCQDMRDCRRRPKLPKNFVLEENWLQNYANEESLEPTIISLFHSRLESAAVIIPYGSKVNLKKTYYRIELFPWNFNLVKMMSLLDRLSPVFTEIIVVSSYLADFQVNLEDDVDGSFLDGTRLQKFTVHLDRRQLTNMKEPISDHPDIQHLIKEEKTSDNLTIRIRKCLDPPVSAGSLVRLALERIIAAEALEQ